MKKMNELLQMKSSLNSNKNDLPNEAFDLPTSIIEKEQKTSQKIKEYLSKFSANSRINFYESVNSPSEKNKIFKTFHIKNNQSLSSLKEMSLPLMGKNKLILSDNFNKHIEAYFSQSRFQEINSLQNENKYLKTKLDCSQSQLKEVDEFKIAINSFKSPENFNEKRINCLKGQLLKQQKYIKHLEKTIKLMKLFHEDSKSFLSLFIDISSENQDKIKTKFKFKPPISIDESLIKLDSDSLKESLDKLMRNFKHPDLLKEFMENFNVGFNKMITLERDNEEFKAIFKTSKEKSDKTIRKLEYQNPITAFVDKYRSFFKIKTIFDVIEPKEKERISTNFEHLLVLNRKLEGVFKKINSIDIFKNNDFYVNPKTEDFASQENRDQFIDFLAHNSQTHFIGMNYDEIMSLETGLANLLNDLIYFEYDFIYQKEEITLRKINNVQQKLRKGIERLIELGVRLSDTDDANLLYVLEKKVQNEREIMQKSKEKNELYVFIASKTEEIKREFKNCCIYIKEFMVNLPENVLQDELQQKKIKKIDFIVDILISIFEQKEVFAQILELDLIKQKETIDLIKEAIIELQIFFEKKNNNYHQFFSDIQNKLYEISSTVDVLANNKNDVFFKRMKKKFDQVLEFFAKLPFENPSEKRMKMSRLLEEYELKFNSLLNKWKVYQNFMVNIKKKI